MDNLNDLKKVWLSADTKTLPGAAEMMHIIKKYRSSKLVKKVALILTAMLLTAIMLSVVFLYKSAMVSTRIGEAMMITACVIFVVTNIGSISRLYRVKDHSNKEFITYMEQVQVNRLKYYRGTQVWGFFFVSVGLLLYLYEMVHVYPLLCAISYSLVILYILGMWFIVRPRAYRRHAKKLEETIKKVKRLTDQL